MFNIIITVVFIWLMIKAIGFALKLTWGAARIVASILMVIALPVLILFLLFAGGVLLLIPLAMVGIAAGVLRSCINT